MHFSKILIGTDLSLESQAAFELAAYNKKMEGTEIILLHVHRLVEPLSIFQTTEFWNTELLNEYSKVYRDNALSKLKQFTQKYSHEQNVRCEVIVSTENVAEEICSFAEKEKCDLIVMGSRGHTVLGTVFIGSVVQRVLLLSKFPVLIVPPGENVSEDKKKD